MENFSFPQAISIPPIVYDVPAIYRRKFGPFAVMEMVADPEPAPEVAPEAPSAAAKFIYRAACYFAAAGIAYSLVKVYL